MSEGSKDRSKVSMLDESDVAFWCKKLNCSKTQLHAAVKMVGPAVSRVRAHLNQRR